jgi:hypothetical protein
MKKMLILLALIAVSTFGATPIATFDGTCSTKIGYVLRSTKRIDGVPTITHPQRGMTIIAFAVPGDAAYKLTYNFGEVGNRSCMAQVEYQNRGVDAKHAAITETILMNKLGEN